MVPQPAFRKDSWQPKQGLRHKIQQNLVVADRVLLSQDNWVFTLSFPTSTFSSSAGVGRVAVCALVRVRRYKCDPSCRVHWLASLALTSLGAELGVFILGGCWVD